MKDTEKFIAQINDLGLLRTYQVAVPSDAESGNMGRTDLFACGYIPLLILQSRLSVMNFFFLGSPSAR